MKIDQQPGLATTPTIQFLPILLKILNFRESSLLCPHTKIRWLQCHELINSLCQQATSKVAENCSSGRRVLSHSLKWPLNKTQEVSLSDMRKWYVSDPLFQSCSSLMCFPAPPPGLLWAFGYWPWQCMNVVLMQNSMESWVSNTQTSPGVSLSVCRQNNADLCRDLQLSDFFGRMQQKGQTNHERVRQD